jgi:hypothetical protein
MLNRERKHRDDHRYGEDEYERFLQEQADDKPGDYQRRETDHDHKPKTFGESGDVRFAPSRG